MLVNALLLMEAVSDAEEDWAAEAVGCDMAKLTVMPPPVPWSRLRRPVAETSVIEVMFTAVVLTLA